MIFTSKCLLPLDQWRSLLMKQKLLLVSLGIMFFSLNVLMLPSSPLPSPLPGSPPLYVHVVCRVQTPARLSSTSSFQGIFPESSSWQYFHPCSDRDGGSSIWNLWPLSSLMWCLYKPSYSKLLGSRICVLISSFLSELCIKSQIRNELIG